MNEKRKISETLEPTISSLHVEEDIEQIEHDREWKSDDDEEQHLNNDDGSSHEDDDECYEEDDDEVNDEDEDESEEDEGDGSEVDRSDLQVFDSPFFHLAQTMDVRNLFICRHCRRRGDNVCTGCKGVYYCSRECQRKDWKKHKELCQEVTKAMKQCREDEEKLLQKLFDDSHEIGCSCHDDIQAIVQKEGNQSMFCNFDLIQTISQHFHVHRDYTEYSDEEDEEVELEKEDDIYTLYAFSLAALSQSYLKLDDPDSGRDLLQTVMWNPSMMKARQAMRNSIIPAFTILQLSRNNQCTAFDILPDFFLRIDQDQLAYDFIHWYAKYVPARDHDSYDWKDKTKPFLSDWKRDRSETDILDILNQATATDSMHLIHLFCLALIKVKLALHFFSVKAFYAFLGCVFSDPYNVEDKRSVVARKLAGNDRVLHLIRSYLLDSNNLPSSQFALRDPAVLLQQATSVMLECEQHNSRIWKALCYPIPLFSKGRPKANGYATHSVEECYYVLETCRHNWYRDSRAMKVVFLYVKKRGTGWVYDADFTESS